MHRAAAHRFTGRDEAGMWQASVYLLTVFLVLRDGLRAWWVLGAGGCCGYV